jgi:hypothetical protein
MSKQQIDEGNCLDILVFIVLFLLCRTSESAVWLSCSYLDETSHLSHYDVLSTTSRSHILAGVDGV